MSAVKVEEDNDHQMTARSVHWLSTRAFYSGVRYHGIL